MNFSKQKTILCYGDSNTWGFIAEKADYAKNQIGRYPRNIRWPGLLQMLLGDDYYVIEEGLNGRTTNLDYQVPPNRNGKTYLLPCLYSHAPIDLVVILLGGNDLKSYFNRSAEDIAGGLEELIHIIQSTNYGPALNRQPEVLVLSQPIPLSTCEEYVDEEGICVFSNAISKAESMVSLYSDVAKKNGCHFLDISKSITPCDFDGMHLDEMGHQHLAHQVRDKVVSLRGNK